MLCFAALVVALALAGEASAQIEGLWVGKVGCQTTNFRWGESPPLEHDGQTERYGFWRFDPASSNGRLRSPVSCSVPELRGALLKDAFTFYSYLRPRGTTRQRLVLVGNAGNTDLIISLDPKDDATYTFRAQYSPSNVQTCEVPAALVPLDEWVYLVKSCRLTEVGTMRCTLFVSDTVVCVRDFTRDFAVATRMWVGYDEAAGAFTAASMDVAFSAWNGGTFNLVVPTTSPTLSASPTRAPTAAPTASPSMAPPMPPAGGDDTSGDVVGGGDDNGSDDDDGSGAPDDQGDEDVDPSVPGGPPSSGEGPPDGGDDRPPSPESEKSASVLTIVISASSGALAASMVAAFFVKRSWSRALRREAMDDKPVLGPGPGFRSSASTCASVGGGGRGEADDFAMSRSTGLPSFVFGRLPIFSRMTMRPVSAASPTIDV